jgi:hypothetical protein
MSRRSTIAAAGLLTGLAVTSSIAPAGSAAAASCTRTPQQIPASRLLLSGARRSVPVGAIVYAVIVEAGKYTDTSYPPSFPWLAVRSPDHHVLAPVRLCKATSMSSLSLSIAAFRAEHAGEVTLTGPLAPRWATVKSAPSPYHAAVAVRG